jgi:hypothetical protein
MNFTPDALGEIARIANLSANNGVETVAIETFWGWHYIIDTTGAVPSRVIARVSLRGDRIDYRVELSTDDTKFVPTAADLGIRP